jgi:predicted ATPase
MISSIALTNFKCFRHAQLDLAALNVLAGVNGAGKSTVIQSLLALRQSWESGNLSLGRFQLNGALTELGTAKEVYCAEPTSEFVELAFASSALGGRLDLKSRQSGEGSNEYFFSLEVARGPEVRGFELFQEPFNYLHAERIGPRKAFPIPPDEGHPLRVGRYGENAPFIVASDRNQAQVTNQALLSESPDGKIYSTLQYQLPLWMARLFPGFEAESAIYSEADQVRLGLALQRKQTSRPLFVRPTNTGFGVSFVLGVVVAGLVAQPNTILIVENPEAHLHPRAQSGIGEFLARVAKGGVQVFVETHSEHVLNGVRRMVRQTILTPDDIRLHYFVNSELSIEPVLNTIQVSATGDISQWPEGFFDQLDYDLSIILG